MSDRIPSRLALFSAAALALTLGSCATQPSPAEMAILDQAIEQKAILPAPRAERDAADRQDLLTQAAFWGREYDKNPNDAEATFKLARVLRAIGSSQRASEVAAPALNRKPDDVELAIVFAQASLDLGQPDAAAQALAQAEAAGQKDWRMLSIIGVTMDQLGQHADARNYYQRALALSPDNPKILSNLGLSYALEGDPKRAEETLREALARPDADPRVKQNLALVLGVQGKFDEAARIAGAETPKALVDSNTAYFKALLSPGRNWDKMRAGK